MMHLKLPESCNYIESLLGIETQGLKLFIGFILNPLINIIGVRKLSRPYYNPEKMMDSRLKRESQIFPTKILPIKNMRLPPQVWLVCAGLNHILSLPLSLDQMLR